MSGEQENQRMNMDTVQKKYERIMKELEELQGTEQVKRYLELSEDREHTIELLRALSIANEENIDLGDEGTISFRLRRKVSYDEERIREEDKDLYLQCLETKFSPKRAEQIRELNKYATIEETPFTCLLQKKDGESNSGERKDSA